MVVLLVEYEMRAQDTGRCRPCARERAGTRRESECYDKENRTAAILRTSGAIVNARTSPRSRHHDGRSPGAGDRAYHSDPVVTPRSRYRPTDDPTYSHRFHAGNVGDVWKHCALVEILRGAARAGRVRYLDTHAGEGRYALGPTGEWSEGIGRLRQSGGENADDPVGRYAALASCLVDGPAWYPGSPAFARAVLGPDAELSLWERDEAAFARLAAPTDGDRHVRLVCGDGLGTLPEQIRAGEAAGAGVGVLVDR